MVKPDLVIGLGNPLMGDEGIGHHVAHRLSGDPRLPADTEVLCGGTDLLRWADRMEGRRRVLLIDALLDPSAPGTISLLEGDFSELDNRQGHAHHLSAVQSINLLRAVSPSLRRVRFSIIAVAVDSARVGEGLSSAFAAKLPRILDQVLQQLGAA